MMPASMPIVNRWTVGLSLLMAISLPLLTGCSSLQSMLDSAPKPTASLKDVGFKSLSLTKAVLQFDAEITNPYDVPLPLVNLDYGLTSGESRLLKGVADLQGTIPAKQSKVVSLPVDVSLADVIRFGKGVKAGAPIPYVADVKLGVNAPGVGPLAVPMGKKGEIKLPSIPGL